MTNNRETGPQIRIVKAMSFNGYVLLRNHEIIATAHSQEEAEEMRRQLQQSNDP